MRYFCWNRFRRQVRARLLLGKFWIGGVFNSPSTLGRLLLQWVVLAFLGANFLVIHKEWDVLLQNLILPFARNTTVTSQHRPVGIIFSYLTLQLVFFYRVIGIIATHSINAYHNSIKLQTCLFFIQHEVSPHRYCCRSTFHGHERAHHRPPRFREQ